MSAKVRAISPVEIGGTTLSFHRVKQKMKQKIALTVCDTKTYVKGPRRGPKT